MLNFNLDSCLPYPFVGLFGCEEQTPTSGLFVNDLEGINIIRVSQLTEPEAPTVSTKFKSIYRRALSEFYQDIITGLDYEYLEFNSGLTSMRFIGEIGDTTTCFEADEIGYEITRNLKDPLSLLQVGQIKFIPCGLTFGFSVLIRENGVITKQILHQAIPNVVNTINIDYSTYADSFTIVLRICGESILDSNTSNCYTDDNCGYSCECFTARGIYKQVGSETFEYLNNIGIEISGNCVCDPTALICKYAQQLAVPFRYKLGIAIIEDALNSDNITPLTTGSRESNIQLLKSWQGFTDPISYRWVAGKYPQSLKNVLKFISKSAHSINSDCLICTGLKYQAEVY